MTCNPSGIAIDTGLSRQEEFPRFRAFWLVEPKPALKTSAPAKAKPAAMPAVATASPAPATKSRDAEWKTPPEGRQVRVISGVTPVMGKDDPAKTAE